MGTETNVSEETEEKPNHDLPVWVNRYLEDGLTLEQVGDELGITREAVRLRLKKLGIRPRTIAEAGAIRTEKTRAAEQARIGAAVVHWSPHRELIEEMSRNGCTQDQAITRLVRFFPTLPDADLANIMDQWGMVFRSDARGLNAFSDAALNGALLYLIGADRGFLPDAEWAAVHLDQDIIEDVTDILSEVNVDPADIATVLSVIGAAQRAAEEGSVTIVGKQYEALRVDLLEALGLMSAKGMRPWPPTRQTFMHRFGSWNDALSAFGLATTGRGRQKGHIKYSAQDYTSAVGDFLACCADIGRSHTFAAYGEWVKEEAKAGTIRPSDAAVRGFFGSWREAELAVATGFVDVKATRAAGTPLYQEEEILASLRAFIAEATGSAMPVQYLEYQEWARHRRANGERRPSAGAVQKAFGSWNAGLRAARKGSVRVDSPDFFIQNHSRQIRARGRLVGEEFVILEGPRIVVAWIVPTGVAEETLQKHQHYVAFHEQLAADGSLCVEGVTGEVIRDIVCTSSTEAASLALGRLASGRTEWVNAEGQSFGEWENQIESDGMEDSANMM